MRSVPWNHHSRSDESAFLTFVFYTLVTALGEPSDLFFAAVRAFEEGVACTLKPDAARGTNFVCHECAIIFHLYKKALSPSCFDVMGIHFQSSFDEFLNKPTVMFGALLRESFI